MVAITIDGQEVKVPLGTTILDAGPPTWRPHTYSLPHDDLCIAGVGRVCLVEVQGQRPCRQVVPIRSHSDHSQ